MNELIDYSQLNSTLLEMMAKSEELRTKAEMCKAEEFCRKILAETEFTNESFDLWKQDEVFKQLLIRREGAYALLGRILLDSGKSHNEAIDYFQKSYSISDSIGDKKLSAIGLSNIGVGFSAVGEYEKSTEHYNRALALCEEIGEVKFQAALLHNRAANYSELSDNYRAFEDIYRAISINEEFGNNGWLANNYLDLGLNYLRISDYTTALRHFSKSQSFNETIGNIDGVAKLQNAIGGVYFELEEYSTAVEYFEKSLELAVRHELRLVEATALTNVGCVLALTGEYDLAIEYLLRALGQHRSVSAIPHIPEVLANLADIHLMAGYYDKAHEYLIELDILDPHSNNKASVSSKFMCYGKLYAAEKFSGCNIELAEDYFKKAISIAVEHGLKKEEIEALKFLVDLVRKNEKWQEYALALERYSSLKEEVHNSEVKKLAMKHDFEFKQSEREKDLAVERAKHEATEQLLHNVLPPSIAHRMIQGESLIAEKLSNVSVLFADIVNFTNLSQRITAEELVAGLDRIFSEFDALAEKHGLEKIKTIGDAYMVVSGAPEPREDHAQAMAFMAIEMLEAMKQFKSISTGEEIQIRIGIHSGEVVAGVIGKKKFAYDLWGDAVNTASRMESHGKAGKIHVSSDFVRELKVNSEQLKVGKDGQQLITINSSLITAFPRGEMEIKGKGMMKTYFLEKNVNNQTEVVSYI